MTWLTALWRLLGPCRHADSAGASLMYRERRALRGSPSVTLVMHLVCDRCGFARPAVDRSDAEHRQATRVTASQRRHAFRVPRETHVPTTDTLTPFELAAADRRKRVAH